METHHQIDTCFTQVRSWTQWLHSQVFVKSLHTSMMMLTKICWFNINTKMLNDKSYNKYIFISISKLILIHIHYSLYSYIITYQYAYLCALWSLYVYQRTCLCTLWTLYVYQCTRLCALWTLHVYQCTCLCTLWTLYVYQCTCLCALWTLYVYQRTCLCALWTLYVYQCTYLCIM